MPPVLCPTELTILYVVTSLVLYTSMLMITSRYGTGIRDGHGAVVRLHFFNAKPDPDLGF